MKGVQVTIMRQAVLRISGGDYFIILNPKEERGLLDVGWIVPDEARPGDYLPTDRFRITGTGLEAHSNDNDSESL